MSFDPERFLADEDDYAVQLVREHHGFVLMVCRAYARNDDEADDLAQQTWRSVVRNARTFEGKGRFRAWLHRITTNACISGLRSRRAEREAMVRFGVELATQVRSAAEDMQRGVERRELAVALHAALEKLTDGERTAVTLRVLEGMKTREVAEIMDVQPATVRSHVRHGLNHLRRIMEDPDSELSRHRATP